jgi:predicted aspartyl protease
MALLAGCATPAPDCAERPVATLDITFLHHVAPLFSASMNGMPVKLLLDTGAAISAVTPKTVQSAHLPVYSRHVVTLSGPAGSVQVPMVTVADFRIGGFPVHGVHFADIDIFGRWHEAVLGVVSGTMGAEILRHYDVDLEFPAELVTLAVPSPCPQAAPWPGAQPVRFQLLPGGQILFPISVNGRAMHAILDTGSSLNDMPQSLFVSSGLGSTAPILLHTATGHGIGARTYASKLYGFQSATIGGVSVSHPVFGVGGLAPAGPYAIIGESFIRQHEIYLSYATRTLYIRAAPPGYPAER